MIRCPLHNKFPSAFLGSDKRRCMLLLVGLMSFAERLNTGQDWIVYALAEPCTAPS